MHAKCIYFEHLPSALCTLLATYAKSYVHAEFQWFQESGNSMIQRSIVRGFFSSNKRRISKTFTAFSFHLTLVKYYRGYFFWKVTTWPGIPLTKDKSVLVLALFLRSHCFQWKRSHYYLNHNFEWQFIAPNVYASIKNLLWKQCQFLKPRCKISSLHYKSTRNTKWNWATFFIHFQLYG